VGGGHFAIVSASIAYSTGTDDGRTMITADDFLQNADAARYQAKSLGKDRYEGLPRRT
jgi:GGDEF domain-containing protein